MPELPEVETVRASLQPHVVGRRIAAVELRRRSVLKTPGAAEVLPTALLLQGRIKSLARHGKQLALITHDGRTLCVHLGMSGRLIWRPGVGTADPHTHAIWTLDDASRVLFVDPRRFGGLWAYPSFVALQAARWHSLGPDALHADPAALTIALRQSQRAIKAALLDQSILAGVGNIYADEALFRAGIAPRRRADRLTVREIVALATAVREVLAQAVAARGSTLRDYRDADGTRGLAQALHSVYGRAGKPCVVCGRTLRSGLVAQRTTVWCSHCQAARRAEASHS